MKKTNWRKIKQKLENDRNISEDEENLNSTVNAPEEDDTPPPPPPPIQQPYATYVPPLVQSQSEAEIQKRLEGLQTKNTNFIFTFGNTGSSKTTVLAALSKFIQTNPNYASIERTESPEGNQLVERIILALESKDFPPITAVEMLYEYDVAFKRKKVMDTWLPVTFLEMSGEKHRVIGAGYGGKFPREVEVYLKENDLPIVHLLIVDYNQLINPNRTINQDSLIRSFISYLANVGGDYSKVGLIVSKFDRDKTEGVDFEEIVREYLPRTINLLEELVENPKIFPFSIGKVINNNGLDEIETLDLSDCERIVEWILEVFVDEYVPFPNHQNGKKKWYQFFR